MILLLVGLDTFCRAEKHIVLSDGLFFGYVSVTFGARHYVVDIAGRLRFFQRIIPGTVITHHDKDNPDGEDKNDQAYEGHIGGFLVLLCLVS